MSGNSEGEGLFKTRIREYMDRHPPTVAVEKYYNIVSSYIADG
jgi:hypothetical protein